MMNTNTVVFPAAQPVSISNTSEPAESHPHALTCSHHSVALEICELVYGPTPSSWDSIERLYESSAIYENPILTATSRSVIADIHALSSQFAQLDVPKPVSVLFAIFGVERKGRWADPWFRAVRIWSEVGDVCESDSFGKSRMFRVDYLTFLTESLTYSRADGHRKTIVEHTLHVLILPGLHSETSQPPPSPNPNRTITLDSSYHYSLSPGKHTTLGLDLSIPSPLHLRLPILTRLSFNDVGKITHHRDFWDVKDLLGLVPGMTLTQWISGRIFAQGIRGVVSITRSLFEATVSKKIVNGQAVDEEGGLTPAEAYAKAVKVGMYHSRRPSTGRGSLTVAP